MRQRTPWRGMDVYQIVPYCTKEVGGVVGRRTATLRPAPPMQWLERIVSGAVSYLT